MVFRNDHFPLGPKVCLSLHNFSYYSQKINAGHEQHINIVNCCVSLLTFQEFKMQNTVFFSLFPRMVEWWNSPQEETTLLLSIDVFMSLVVYSFTYPLAVFRVRYNVDLLRCLWGWEFMDSLNVVSNYYWSRIGENQFESTRTMGPEQERLMRKLM